ncbi:MAG: integrase core domain-containing protein, partial [Abditibacteriota bacterium]|nr:integrase core domain-containing protein [Abditibacteriota bacterium]
NCYDNAAAESFIGRLKCEFFKGNKFKSVKDFIEKLNDYIDYYNNRRIKQILSGLSPAQYRQQTGMVA